MPTSIGRSQTARRLVMVLTVIPLAQFFCVGTALAKGEPAENFVKELRNAGYYDTALIYLGRVEKMPGIDASFRSALPLERAQTHIESALRIGNAEKRDEAFGGAEKSLQDFLSSADQSHPRFNEARLQLGKLQMIRAAQLLVGEADAAKRKQARESYLAAGQTFDSIVKNLRDVLQGMRGEKIDADADPEAAARRDQYRFEFLQSLANAADSVKLAAKTFDDPAKQGKAQLEDAAKRFTELNSKYAGYAPGAIAQVHLGDINETLGKDDAALGNYLNMLEEPEVDQLREAKYQAAAGLVRLKMKNEPPKYQDAIDRTSSWVKAIRPNEKNLQVVQEFRMELAKAYLAKAGNKDLKKGEIGRAKSEGRDLLFAASKVPGAYADEAEKMLADLGIEQPTEALPTAETPKGFDDALEKANQILTATSDLEAAVKVLEAQGKSGDIKKQIEEIEKQRVESYLIGVQILRSGLSMVGEETDSQTLNQARQIMAYFLYQIGRHRETVVVGEFLARHAAGTEVGLKGGLMALASMQLLLAEVPDDANGGLIRQLESLGGFMAKTWPDNPNAAAAQGLQIRLLLKKDDFDGAQALIDGMPKGAERASFKRLLGQLFWNQSIAARVQDKDEEKSALLVERAGQNLQAGLDEIPGKLVSGEGMQATLVLAKVYLRQGKSGEAIRVLDHEKYGPIKLIETVDPPSDSFAAELYSTELKALVGEMLASDKPQQYLNRMIDTMEKLRKAYTGPDAPTKLTQEYMRLANDLKAQLDEASPARKVELIKVFREMLKRISESTNDEATLRWVGQTLSSMGEALMTPGQTKANGQAAELIGQAVTSFQALKNQDDVTTAYLLGRSQRLVGEYKASIDTFEKLLKTKPLMLEAQIEAATAYESWAAILPAKYTYSAYRSALEGARKGENGKNTIWGWAEISSKTSKQVRRNENFKEKFFESRYHVALCLYLMGKAANRQSDTKKAIKVIREASTLFPDLGGKKRRAEYDALMKEAQKAVGEAPTGLP